MSNDEPDPIAAAFAAFKKRPKDTVPRTPHVEDAFAHPHGPQRELPRR